MHAKIKDYIEIIEKVARVEHKRIPTHMVDYDELVSIGIIAIQVMIKDKTEEELARYNNAYIATAVRWAIRNELRNRYKWYSLKHTNVEDQDEQSGEDGSDNAITPGKVREAIYETILSIDSLAAAASDNDSPFDFIKDPSALPDEKAEISELGKVIREAIAKLPQKERTIIEYRFYRNMQVKEIAEQIGLSSSRITRIIQGSLNTVREYLNNKHEYAFIVNRIDKETSGLEIFVKKESLKEKLQSNWNDIVKKRGYIAIVSGIISKPGRIENYLYEDKLTFTHSTKTGGKLAITNYTPIKTKKQH